MCPATLHGALEGAECATPPGPQAGPAMMLVRGEGLGVPAKGHEAGVCRGVKAQGVTSYGSLKAREDRDKDEQKKG